MTAPDRTLDAPGLACIDLTPLIASTMRDLQAGQLLEVHTDDPATADDLVEGATIVTAANLVEALASGASTVTF